MNKPKLSQEEQEYLQLIEIKKRDKLLARPPTTLVRRDTSEAH